MKNLVIIFGMLISSQLIRAQEKSQNEAVLLIEFQKSWTSKTIFNKLVRNELESNNVLVNTKALLDSARTKNISVIHAPLILDKHDSIRYKQTPMPARLLKQFTVNSWKAEFTDGFYENSDIVIKGRCSYDACIGSDLEAVLNKENIKTLYVCGFTTDHCVYKTIKSLEQKGYNCYLVKGATATRNEKLQNKIESKLKCISISDLLISLLD